MPNRMIVVIEKTAYGPNGMERIEAFLKILKPKWLNIGSGLK